MRHSNSLTLILLVLISSSILTLAGNRQKKIDLNSATQADLESIRGIGPSYAARIIHERDRRGGFRSVDDLLKVRGIGRKLLKKMKPYITVKPRKTQRVVQSSLHNIPEIRRLKHFPEQSRYYPRISTTGCGFQHLTHEKLKHFILPGPVLPEFMGKLAHYRFDYRNQDVSI